MKFCLLVTLSFLLSLPLFGAEENLETSVPATSSHSLELVPTFSVLVPSKLFLSGQDYDVLYSKGFLGLSAFHLGLSTPLAKSGAFTFSGSARVGYAFNEGIYGIEPNRTVSTPVSLHWIPFSISTQAKYEIPGFPHIKPFLSLGAGGLWLHQVGKLAGTNEDFVVPYLYATPGLTFMDDAGPDDWFGGFSFGISYQNSLASQAVIHAVSYEMSLRILL